MQCIVAQLKEMERDNLTRITRHLYFFYPTTVVFRILSHIVLCTTSTDSTLSFPSIMPALTVFNY